MYTYENIYQLYLDGLKNQDKKSEMGMKSAVARGHTYYGCLRNLFSIHFTSFSCMHERINKSLLSTDFPRNLEGFINYIIYMGPIPADMVKPTAGRIDHDKGYIIGNFSWQSSTENNKEVGLRNSENKVNIKFVKGSKFYTNGIDNFKLLPDDPKIKELNLVLGHTYKPDKKVVCPHCNIEGGEKRMKQIHFDKCKFK